MPTRIIGKNADFGISLAAKTVRQQYLLADVTLFELAATDFSITIDTNIEESTGYEVDWKEREIIDAEWSVDFTTFYSNAAATPDIDALMFDLTGADGITAKRAVSMYPNGQANPNSASQPMYSGLVIITSRPIAMPRGGLVVVRGRLQGDGELFRDTSTANP